MSGYTICIFLWQIEMAAIIIGVLGNSVIAAASFPQTRERRKLIRPTAIHSLKIPGNENLKYK